MKHGTQTEGQAYAAPKQAPQVGQQGAAKRRRERESASQLIDERIRELGGWRGKTLARMRALIREAHPEIIEEWKWSNPVWSHHSIVCTGEAYKNVVKLTFARGASIPDPSRLFNSSLGGNTRRALDIHEGEKVDADEFKALVKAAVAQNRATLKKAKRAELEAKPVKLLTGGNPQIAKADGDAPVQSYIAAMPGWMREVGRRLDMLIARDSRRAQRSQMELSLLRCRGQRLVCHFPYLYELREGNLFPRHVAPTRSTRREIQGCALDRYPQGRFRRGADGKVDPPGGRRARLGQVVVDVRGSGRSLSARRHRREKICRVVLGVTLEERTLSMTSRKATLTATCHCGAIRIHVARMSRTLTSCNCSICRRYGALWAYYAASSVKIEAPKGGLAKYSWNRKIRAYYRCRKCGCVTHYAYRKRSRNTTVAVNAVNFEPAVLVGTRIRHLDGAASWKFLD